MNSQTASSRSELEFAEVALRDILIREFAQDAKGDAKSLGRMLVHLVNMHEAICVSPERHANVAKRLGDFAGMTSRMADRNPAVAEKLTRLSGMLSIASARLRDTVPVATAVPEPVAPQVDFGLGQQRGRVITHRRPVSIEA